MEFIINPTAYSRMFPLPDTLVDENIKLASAIQLRVILYFYRHAAMGEKVTCEQIAQAIGKDSEDVEDAMLYWLDRGLILKNGEQVDFSAASVSEPPESVEQAEPIKTVKPPKKKQVEQLPISRPSHEQIAIRCSECAEFRELFAEAQQRLGKTIGYDGQSILIMLHDSYGLPIEVILMLIEYAVSLGKNSFKYIANLGKIWSENDIDTYEAAEQYIQQRSGVNGLWKEFRSLTGVKNSEPTTKQRRFFNAWQVEYGFNAQMIYLAYEISIENTEKMSLEYMDRVLKNWHGKGIKTPVDVGREQQEWADSKKKSDSKKSSKSDNADTGNTASYDLDAYTKKSIGLKYKKNN
ncbi:MAG: DnaD domain protein [Faecalibacterium sp.]|nr:DnaD domain protein [Ruminococcus sp.]MCM1392614.1 DnaD domain protein [Ruminococcus sp.]MCM1486434.1 DnaD domain protein [Faecalibacterium sp.]